MTEAWKYTLVPALLTVAAAAAAARLRPAPTTMSVIQHVAAGVVFAAAASEILPEIKHEGSAMATLIGGGLGVAVMWLVKQAEDVIEGPAGLLTTVGVDILIDGLVLGIAFAAGMQAGILLTVALSLEVVFLGLALSGNLTGEGWSRTRAVAVTAGLATLLPVGALLAVPVAALSPPVVSGFLSFGLVALLYLVTEELLVEAHERAERPWVAAMFFAGFLSLLLIEELMA
ncbi:MAG: transporter [Rhodobacteraceae bacterium]|nr:transporter [Paracoccaceae bacterium]MBR27357.1 transporter [Paracoccaceae bacterium]